MPHWWKGRLEPGEPQGDHVTLDLEVAQYSLSGLRPFPVAVTTVHDGRTNGMIALSGGSAGIIPEAPRVSIGITKYNFSHDLVLVSGIFVMHLLGNGDLLEGSLRIIQALAGRSGREGDKLSGLAIKTGETGAPILLDALTYVEGRVNHSLDTLEDTIFVANVVGSERLHEGGRLNIAEAWAKLPPDWVERYERNHAHQVNAARRARGLPEQ
jgi:flavin reductase (DIM6/NTAB) family NADH-FMN oxidoreductase RutF